jgi:valyl-tRNA synthetase
MTAEAGLYAGLDRFAPRQRVVAGLDALGLFAKVEPYTVRVGCCQNCKTVVEPMVSTPWFARLKPLAEPASGPWNKIYFDWMRNLRDWCVSRQLW